MCAWCERFEDGLDRWKEIEVMVEGEAKPEQVHCICPDCYETLAAEVLRAA
jgi:hypothetical protein